MQGTDSMEAPSERPAIGRLWSSFKRTALQLFREPWGGVKNIKDNSV